MHEAGVMVGGIWSVIYEGGFTDGRVTDDEEVGCLRGCHSLYTAVGIGVNLIDMSDNVSIGWMAIVLR